MSDTKKGAHAVTNFDFLYADKRFSSFAGAAAAAEKIYGIDTAACVVNARRAAELAVKWMYETDRALPEPKRDQLAALVGASEFRALVGHENVRALEFIRRAGNNAAHNPESVTRGQAELALRSLYAFACFLSEHYARRRVTAEFDASLLDPEAELVTEAFDSEDIKRLVAENRALKRMLNMRRDDAEPQRSPLSEADTRRMYIETDLAYAGWRAGIDLFSEFRVDGMPGKTGVGYADYVLCGDDGVPLALVESQATSRDPAIGRQQAKLYADSLEKRFGVRPVIFLSSGFETRVWFDTDAPERRVGGFYAKSDLLRAAALRASRRAPQEDDIAACRPDRPYQTDALRALSDAFCTRRERTVFLSMAPGTGKTRAALNAVALLRRCGWIRNVLYLADNDLLAAQAMREFAAISPEGHAARLTESAEAAAETLFATFDDMLAEADEATDRAGNHIFTAGRFDLVVCDEISRTLAERYGDVFAAFDAPLLAMTSVPEAEIDPVLCDLLGGAPKHAAFSYPHARAVADGFLAPFTGTDARFAFLEDGIRPAALRPAERAEYRRLFGTGAYVPRSIRPSQLFTEYYNADTVRQALGLLDKYGLRRSGALGKTIVFTENHAHSEMIYEQWGLLFPAADPQSCRVIDTETNYVQSLIASFADVHDPLCVAISHDLLLDGIDIPPVENLVFFTRATSREKFWRMLGRGMRHTAALPDGKPRFYVLDLCGNFRAFAGDTPEDDGEPLPVRCRIFALQVRIVLALQSLEYAEECAPLRAVLVRAIRRQIAQLAPESFAARRHLAALKRFSEEDAFTALTPRDADVLLSDVAPLILPDAAPPASALFDEQMYALLLHRALHENCEDETAYTMRCAGQLAALATHPKIARQKKLLHRILYNGYLGNSSLSELDEARRALSPLVRLLGEDKAGAQRTPFTDCLLSAGPLPDSYLTGTPEVSPSHDTK